MPLVVISGIAIFILITFLSISSANTLYTRELARRGAVRPISEDPVAGILTAGAPTNEGAIPVPPAPSKTYSSHAHRPTIDPTELSIDLTPSVRAEAIAASIPPFDFAKGKAGKPVFQRIFTYVSGLSDFEESFSIRDEREVFFGEIGAGINRSIPMEDAQGAVAIDLWLFDKDDIKSPTLSFVGPRTKAHPSLTGDLKRRGAAVEAKPGARFSVETESLLMEVIVVDRYLMEFDDAGPDVIKSIVLEAAIWVKNPATTGSTPELKPVIEKPAPAPPVEPIDNPDMEEQKIRTSYTIDFTRKTYLNQPFKVTVNIPGLHEDGAEEAAPPRPTISGMPRSPGELAFTHRWYPEFQENARKYPMIRVKLVFDEEDFQVPNPEASAMLYPNNPTQLEFIAKPLRPDVLLLSVEIYYIGVKWSPEKEVEVLTTRDANTGEVRTITTRTTPAKLTGAIRLLSIETLRVDVRSFLTLNAPELNGITRIVSGVMIVTYVLWAMISGEILSLGGGLTVAGFALGSALITILSPFIVGAYFSRRGR